MACLFYNLLAESLVDTSLFNYPGGLFSVFFAENLFLPLIPAACLSVVATIVAYMLLLDPGITVAPSVEVDGGAHDDATPASFRVRVLLHIIVGAMVDNLGSLGIVPLGLSPVMYQTFFAEPLEEGLDPGESRIFSVTQFEYQQNALMNSGFFSPVMTYNQYRWIYSMIVVVAIPSAL